MRLRDLEPQLVRLFASVEEAKREKKEYLKHVDDLAEAQGIRFLCPKCFRANEGPVGTHQVLLWFAGRGVPSDVVPAPGRWAVNGTGFEDLSLVPSVSLTTGCMWHGFVTDGDVTA